MTNPIQQAESRLSAVRAQLASAYERELATTSRVLQAYPPEQSELRPHERAKNARELAWALVVEQRLAIGGLTGTLDLSGGFPAPPQSFAEVVAAFTAASEEVIAEIRGCSEPALAGTTRFFTGPGVMGDIPNVEFLWFLLHDHIHHRGQFSVYLRMAGGKVPSIYGPSADEPWS